MDERIDAIMVRTFEKEDFKGLYSAQDYELTIQGNEPVDLPAICASLKAALEMQGLKCHSVEPVQEGKS